MKSLIITFLFISTLFPGQNEFKISHRKKTVIPFQFINNLIFVPLNINGVDLTFLLDSGVNETILFSLDNKEINFNNIEKIKFSGLGENKNIEGLRSDNNIVSIGKDFKDLKHTVFIILDESINFSSHVGISVNGIIGYQFFKDHPVEIDFISKKITVFNDLKLMEKRKKKFDEFPMSVEGNKPYMTSQIEITDEKVNSKMLLDLGNSDAIWLFPKLIENFVYNRPNIEDYLGQGFNGSIFGKRSIIHQLAIGNFTFEKPLTAMPDEFSIQHLKIVADRKGSIGSEILRRFNVIFDYPRNKIYLQKNRNYSNAFLFNKSGLDIQHDGMTWEKDLVTVATTRKNVNSDAIVAYEARDSFRYNFVLKPRFSVAGCRIDAPCFISGMRTGDKIISINKRKIGDFTLEKINALLKEEDGTKITFDIERENKNMTFQIVLTDPIPYQDAN